MIPIKQLHEWIASEIYQQYVKQLLIDNPLVESTVKEQLYKNKGSKKKAGFRRRKVYESGYWTRFNKKARFGSNYWVYTKKKVGNRYCVVEVINYKRFIKVLDTYFSKAREYIIYGDGLKIGAGVGTIQAKHVERNHANKKINWYETKKQPLVDQPDGTKKYARVIYFTDDTWIRIDWMRANRLTNERSYKFDPSSEERANGRGFMDLFKQANQRDPNLRLKYPFYPYIQNTA